MPTAYPILRIKPEKEIHLRNRHHAIFKNAIDRYPEAKDGSIVEVRDSGNGFLCYATWNSTAYICGRAISFEMGDPLETMKRVIRESIAMRRSMLKNEETTAYRLVNAEGDALPGLIVDQYGNTLVMQLTTMGMDNLRDWLADFLMEEIAPAGIFEKSTGSSRKKEGLENKEGWLRGKGPDSLTITERGLRYKIVLAGSQKTGLFLDQRDMRNLVKDVAHGRTVLDCCSYVGGFSVNALAGGALVADAVDYDHAALAVAKENVEMNGIEASRFAACPGDVFEFLRKRPLPHAYDFIILDPPAFAKRSSDIDQAKRAYTDMNRLALEILPPGGLLLTCSCSYQMEAALFQTIVFHAARMAKRSVRILQRHRAAFDHPVNLFHPETDYLKSLLLWVE